MAENSMSTRHGNQREVRCFPIHELSYIAGAMDCDGCFNVDRTSLRAGGIRKQGWKADFRYQPFATLINVNTDIMAFFKSRFGGAVNPRKKEKAHHLQSYRWRLAGPTLTTFLSLVRPYLVVKPRQCDLLIQARLLIESRHRGRGNPMTDGEKAEFDSIYLSVRKLNGMSERPQRLIESASQKLAAM